MNREPATNDDQQAPRPVLAVICGLPATGKSTLAEQVQRELGWPLFTKDGFKELLFDVGYREGSEIDRAESTRIGAQAIALVFLVARELLGAGQSCIIEANFLPNLAPADLGPLKPFADLRQVHCTIPDDQVIERYRGRADAGERHPVHADVEALDDLIERIEQGGGRPLPLDIPLLQVDSTDGFNPPLAEIVAFLRAPAAT